MSEFADLMAEHPWVTIGVVAVVLLTGWLRRPRRAPQHPTRSRGALPRPGEVWFAQVPFEDGTGSKDRPVLVLSTTVGSWQVARFTSQDRSGRQDFLRVPQGMHGLPTASWLDRRPLTLDRTAFRRHVGDPGEAFVAWYQGATENRG
ncbi:hypothetical protein [uncultured Cellulomonas sp.]|uniref:hypothetical protein n=1 Tax=uncultured Cellulomonas sp. TaxID=189682 RepID=UPI0028E805B3|nr:hypothetical protein [uncultured Cellulomonas sp.]